MRIFYILALFFSSCLSTTDDMQPSMEMQEQEETQQDETTNNIVNILFFGNSLTYFNEGIDTHVQSFYDVGNPNITAQVTRMAFPNYTLDDHLRNNQTQTILKSEAWNFIILQENGILATTNPSEMLASIATFKSLIDTNKTRVFLFLTWAYEGRPEMTQELVAVYNQAAKENNFTVVPVGLGWRDFYALDNDIDLLSLDGVHPSKSGTYYNACMFFSVLSEQFLENSTYHYDLSPEQANIIKNHVSTSLGLYY